MSRSNSDKNNELQKPKIVKESEGHKLNVLGDHQNIRLTGADTNGQFTLIEQFNEPGVGIPPHIHENEDEVFQVLAGQVENHYFKIRRLDILSKRRSPFVESNRQRKGQGDVEYFSRGTGRDVPGISRLTSRTP